ncbi:hypothetical protein ACFLU6_06095 [Acidobacteriota bacterium]
MKLFKKREIHYAYLHVGPIEADGSIKDSPGSTFFKLRKARPDLILLAWLGCRLEKIDIDRQSWREGLLVTIDKLIDQGFSGVHLNIEPIPNRDEAYLALLDAIRSRFGINIFLSQSTPRTGPFGVSVGPMKRYFWSEDYYKATMSKADQTVLMAYDTMLPSSKLYVGFVRHQTAQLLSWAAYFPGHQVLVGIPSYEDVPKFSDPSIENIKNASLGVRSALEKRSTRPSFEGVAVYSNWVTDHDEWRQYDRYWLIISK